MSTRAASFFQFCIGLFALGALLAAVSAAPGGTVAPVGMPDDWTHHHAVFSYPGTYVDAIRNGTYDRWIRIVSDPRFLLQQRKREAAAAARLNPVLPSSQTVAEAPAEDTEPPEDFNPRQMMPRRGITPATTPADDDSRGRRHHHHKRHHKHAHSNLHMDWSENMGSAATVGLGMYPAKFSFGVSTANCSSAASPDFVVYNTSLAGTGMAGSTQASIVAYDNLYTGCTGTVPSVYWAYDTAAGTILTSVTLSLDGSQVAFVQTTASAASLVILKWAASNTETPTSPAVLASTAALSYRGCTAPCMTVIPFSGGANDSGSSVYPDYGSDTIYVGDDAGKLHKFTGVFKGTPAEAGAPWPVTVSTGGEALSSPVFDPVSGNVLVGDYLPPAMPNCATVGCGFLYSVNATSGAVVQSARLDYVFGLIDGPLLDIAAQTAYAFVGADNNFQNISSPCGGAREPCSGIFQLPTTFGSNAAGTEARLGNGFQFMLTGAFDNKFLTSTPGSPTGNLYVVGNTGNANNTLFQIPITANVMGAPVSGPAISTNFTDGSMQAAGMSLTEIFSNSHDYILTSAIFFSGLGTCTSNISLGCVMGFDVTMSNNITFVGASNVAGGASAIIIDNVVTGGGASNIYYTPLANQLCTTSATTGGCAIQISQSSP